MRIKFCDFVNEAKNCKINVRIANYSHVQDTWPNLEVETRAKKTLKSMPIR